jgi:hypothetical protein
VGCGTEWDGRRDYDAISRDGQSSGFGKDAPQFGALTISSAEVRFLYISLLLCEKRVGYYNYHFQLSQAYGE